MPRLRLPVGEVEGDLLVLDKDGVLLDFHACWVAISRSRAEAISRLIAQPVRVDGLLGAWGVGPEGRVTPTGVLATGTRSDARAVAAAWLHQQGLPWTQAREAAHLGFETGDAASERLRLGPPLPGVPEALRHLRASGWRLAVATSDQTDSAVAFLASLNVLEAFEAVVGADRVANSKPDPEMFLLACAGAGVPPGRAVMVGDADVDLLMGQRSGALATIGVLSGVGDAALLGRHADLVLTDLAALTAFAMRGA